MAAVLRDMKQFIGVDPHLPSEQPQLEHANDHRGKADPRKKEENKDEQVGRGGGPVALGSTASGRQHPDMLPCNAARLFLQAPIAPPQPRVCVPAMIWPPSPNRLRAGACCEESICSS